MFQVEKKILKARDTSLEESKRDRAGWIMDGQESRILRLNLAMDWYSTLFTGLLKQIK